MVKTFWSTQCNQLPDDFPQSNPVGKPLDVYFKNESLQPVIIYRLDKKGILYEYGTLERGWFKPYRARAGEVCLATGKQNTSIGYFLIGNQMSDVIIRK